MRRDAAGLGGAGRELDKLCAELGVAGGGGEVITGADEGRRASVGVVGLSVAFSGEGAFINVDDCGLGVMGGEGALRSDGMVMMPLGFSARSSIVI